MLTTNSFCNSFAWFCWMFMMRERGIEPPTFGFGIRRSTNWATPSKTCKGFGQSRNVLRAPVTPHATICACWESNPDLLFFRQSLICCTFPITCQCYWKLCYLHQEGIEPPSFRGQRKILPLYHWCPIQRGLGFVHVLIRDFCCMYKTCLIQLKCI